MNNQSSQLAQAALAAAAVVNEAAAGGAVSPNTSAADQREVRPTIVPEFQEKKNPVIRVGNRELDRDTFFVASSIILAWVLIWVQSGLFDLIPSMWPLGIVFTLFIVWCLANIVTAGTKSGSVVYELNILLTVEQMVSILFGTMVLFALFQRKLLKIEGACKPIIATLTIYILLLLTIASSWVNVFNSGRAFKAVRRMKQGIYNISLGLFIVICLLTVKCTI